MPPWPSQKRREVRARSRGEPFGGRTGLEPAGAIGCEAHQDETGNADSKLRHYRIFVTGDDELSGNSKKRTETEYLQGVLSASANRLQKAPFEESGVWPHRQPHHPGKRQEVNEPQDIEVRFVDRIDLAGKPVRNEALQRIILPGQGDKG